MNTNPNYTVSVVIPCYNQGQYINEALESLENSTYSNIEVIIVDDGSNNKESLDYLHASKDVKIKGNSIQIVFQETNKGPSATRNFGAEISTGDILLFLDADDKIDSTYIEKSIWILTKYPTISFVYPAVQQFGTSSDLYLSRPYDYRALLNDNFIVVSSILRKTAWRDVGGFDENIKGYEDWDFWIRIGATGNRGYWLKEPLFFYRRSESSRLIKDNSKRRMLVKVIKKKNNAIYKKFMNKNSNDHSISSRTKGKLSLLKWRVFVLYVRMASMIPGSVKNRLKHIVKPIIRNIFKYEETGYVPIPQFQVLETNHIDDHVGSGYNYKPNNEYIKVMKLTTKEETAKSNRLNILFIVPWTVVGGADKVNLDLISEFSEKGHRVHLFTTLSNEHSWHLRFKAITENITHLGNLFSNLDELIDYVNDYIAAHSINVVQMSNSQLGYQIAEPIKRTNQDIVIVDLNHMEEPYAPFDYFRYSVRYKDWFDHRIVITPYLKEVMIRKYGETAERVSVIPNGIKVPSSYESTNYAAKNYDDSLVIGFIGRIEEQKQPLDFVKVASMILSKTKKVEFLMVGDGSLLHSCKSLAKSLGITSKIQFLGSRDDALDIMKEKMHLFLAPSLREGLPIVGLEALSLGVPIIATDVPGWKDLVFKGETGYLTPINDCSGMAHYCIEMLNNSQLRWEISQKAYHLASSKYSLDVTAGGYLNIYINLLDTKQPTIELERIN